jgi:hypothetical protein
MTSLPLQPVAGPDVYTITKSTTSPYLATRLNGYDGEQRAGAVKTEAAETVLPLALAIGKVKKGQSARLAMSSGS